MRFLILGPLEVHGEDGALRLGGIKPRAVLAVLLLHANEPVSADRLALALWGEDVAGGATKTVRVHVSRLRRALGDGDVITTTTAGYCLRVGPDELDATQFERLVEEGRRALAGGQSEYAAGILRDALAMWRGPALAELAFEPFAHTEVARLEEQRLAALEARIEADLAVSRHAELVAELQQFVAAHPTRERLVEHLMLALYRCGRQADALEAYQDARRMLITQIGVEPGPQLRALQEAILGQDAALELAGGVPDLSPELDIATSPPLVGREDELAWLRLRWEHSSDGAGGLIVLVGKRGAGKTRIAAELAADAHRRGDAVLYASVSGVADAALRALHSLDAMTRPTLVIVDDVEVTDADVVQALEVCMRSLASLPVLVIVCCKDADMLGDLSSDNVLTLEPLTEESVRAIACYYASGAVPAEIPAERLLEASGGLPRRVHDLAAQWARREAGRRVSVVAGRAESEREHLRTIQSDLVDDVIELQETRERILPRREGEPVVMCPFKGLVSYDVSDAEYFFGRERLVAELVAHLVGAPLLAVVGPSGSGKSSVLRAGLLPALASGVLPGSENRKQVLIRPGEHPLRGLSDAMAAVDDDRTFVALDQFEEVFTTCEDEAQRTAFIAELVRMTNERDNRCVVVIALRADYYGRCAAYPELSALIAANNVLVRSMRRDELHRAVEGPCGRTGLRIEPELVQTLVADVEHEPGGLPLLSTALLELWQQRDGRHLRHAAYAQTGGVRGAVARLAEDAFRQLDEAQQAVAHGVFRRLVGTGDDDTVERRRVTLGELEVDRSENVARVIALLTDRRLLTVSAGAVEISHEALLREWPRLRGWIEEDRDGIRIQRALSGAAQEWQRLGFDDGALYRGIRLAETVEWCDARDAPLNELERRFLDAGVAGHARERVMRRRRIGLVVTALTIGLAAAVVAVVFANRQRDIAESRDLATKSLSLVATDPGLALTIAFEALRRSDTEQAQNALRQATLAHRATRVIAAHSGRVAAVAPSPDGRFAAIASGDRTVRILSLGSGRRVGEIRGYRDVVQAASFSHDGKHFATASLRGEIAVAATDGGTPNFIKHLKGEVLTSIDFGGDGKTLAIGTFGGRVALVRLRDGAVDYLNSGPGALIYAVDFDSHERRVVSASEDGVARIWSGADGSPIKLPHGGKVFAASFSSDRTRVATAGLSGTVRLWDASSGGRLASIPVSDQPLASVRFSSDGHRIVTGSYDGVVSLFAVRDRARQRAPLAEIKGHKGPARAEFVHGSSALVSAGEQDGTLRTLIPPATRLPLRPGTIPLFSRDGRLVVSGDDSGPIHVWNPATGQDREFIGHKRGSVPQFSPDGSQVISASRDGTVRLWDLRNGRSRTVPTLPGSKFAAAIDESGERIAIGGNTPLVIQAPNGKRRRILQGPRSNVWALTFSPDGKHLLAGFDDGAVRVWNAHSGARERTLRGHEGVVRGVSYSPDGQIATAGSDGTVRVWSPDRSDSLLLAGHEDAVNTAEFNQRGDRLVTAGDDGTVRIWDPASGDALVVLYQHKGIASGADFSLDDHSVVSAGDDDMRITPCEVCGTFAEALRVARTRAQHKLSAAERQRLLPGG
jgi:WD40 repeat protein/DNA-binding SARP family transcriptional activator/energy-coupling factor transporter ATP-binding protein EcfA2